MRSVYDIREQFSTPNNATKDEVNFKAKLFCKENCLRFGECEAEKNGVYMIYPSIFSC